MSSNKRFVSHIEKCSEKAKTHLYRFMSYIFRTNLLGQAEFYRGSMATG